MESLILSFKSVFPIFLLMLLGYFLRRIKLIEEGTVSAVNKLIFRAFLPTLLFYNIYSSGSEQPLNIKLVIFILMSILTVFGVGLIAVLLLTKENPKRGVMLQGFFRSNYAILGIPLIIYICGNDALSTASALVAVVVPTFNVLAVITLEIFRGGRIKFIKLLGGIITNPLVIGCALGGLFSALKITLPATCETAVSQVADIASPLALVILGAGFVFSDIRNMAKELIITVSVRLIVVPLLVVGASVLVGFRSAELATLLVIFGSPVAVSSYAMSQQMGGDEKLAAGAVVLSSATCLVTLFGWIFLLSSLGLF